MPPRKFGPLREEVLDTPLVHSEQLPNIATDGTQWRCHDTRPGGRQPADTSKSDSVAAGQPSQTYTTRTHIHIQTNTLGPLGTSQSGRVDLTPVQGGRGAGGTTRTQSAHQSDTDRALLCRGGVGQTPDRPAIPGGPVTRRQGPRGCLRPPGRALVQADSAATAAARLAPTQVTGTARRTAQPCLPASRHRRQPTGQTHSQPAGTLCQRGRPTGGYTASQTASQQASQQGQPHSHTVSQH